MNILLSAYSCNPQKGGEPSNGWNMADYNTRKGHTVYCLTTPEGRPEIEAQLQAQPNHQIQMIYITVPSWLQQWKNKSPQLGIYFHYFFWQYKAYQLSKTLIKSTPIDLVHHITYGSFQMGSFLWKLKKPMLFGPAGGGQKAPVYLKKYFMNQWKQEVVRELISSLLQRISAKKMAQHVDQLLVSNEETKTLAESLGGQHVKLFTDTLLPDGFFPDTIPVKESSSTLRLLWVGRLLPRKGIFLVLEALSKVSDQHDVHLTIIGDGPNGHQLPGWINELNLQNRVTWEGRKPFAEVKEAYALHDAFIFCSLRESLGAQLIEAMAFGLPVITLDHQGAHTFVPEKAGLKVIVSSPEATLQGVTLAIEKMAKQTEERKAMSEHAFTYAKQFSWSSRVDEIQHIYQQITA